MRETILVVEDGEAVRNLVCRMLVECGYRVMEACDGRDALRICETHSGTIQLVLTDLVMPHMKGTELAEHLRRVCPRVRILLMSGYTEGPTVQEQGRDAMPFLPKPFTSVSLSEKIRQVLDAPWNGSANGRRPDG